MRLAALAMLIAMAGCNDTPTARAVSFGRFEFELPRGWIESTAPQQGAAMWVPKNNTNNESIVLSRASIGAAPKDTDALLSEAQGLLTAQPVTLATVRTPSGLTGSRVELDFVPPGGRTQYHRVHILFTDGSDVVHVLYTARAADLKQSALNELLQTVKHG